MCFYSKTWTVSAISVPSLMTHASVDLNVKELLGIKDNMIRFSVGIEDVDDLIGDLDQALINSKIGL